MPRKIDEITKQGLFVQVGNLKAHISRMEEKNIELHAHIRILEKQKQMLEHENNIYSEIINRYGRFTKKSLSLSGFNKKKRTKESS